MRFDAFILKVSVGVIMKQKNCFAMTPAGMRKEGGVSFN